MVAPLKIRGTGGDAGDGHAEGTYLLSSPLRRRVRKREWKLVALLKKAQREKEQTRGDDNLGNYGARGGRLLSMHRIRHGLRGRLTEYM